MRQKNIYMQKKQLRKKIMLLSNSLEKDYKRRSSRSISERLMATVEYKEAGTIFCFVGMENEVDTRPILEDALARGKRVAVPLVIDKGVMEAKQIRSWEELKVKSFGILEPSDAAQTVLPEEIDLAIVPCLSCSHKGARLGYGGGFYDRFMQIQAFPKFCLCFEKLTSEEIPTGRFDLQMDALITEVGIFDFRG